MRRMILAALPFLFASCSTLPADPTVVEVDPGPIILPKQERWPGIARVERADHSFLASCWHFGGGLMVTCQHVPVGEGEILVDGHPASVIFMDEWSDVAVLRCSLYDGPVFHLAPPVAGEQVRARGYVGSGGYGWTVETHGIISSLDIGGWVAFDGGISPGMSGSPVVNDRGEVVGMVSRMLPAGTTWNPIMGLLCPEQGIETALRKAALIVIEGKK